MKYVRALYDHVSPEPSLLNFKKGDVIKIVPKDDLEEGWVYGIFNNHGGYFPADFVTHIQEVSYSFFSLLLGDRMFFLAFLVEDCRIHNIYFAVFYMALKILLCSQLT